MRSKPMFSFSLISEAFADSPAAGGTGDAFMSFLPIILIFAIFYFLVMRPHSKRMKAHREKISAIHRGDRIITGGGLIGTVVKISDDNEVLVDLGEGTKVRVVKSTIAEVLAKTQPINDNGNDNDKIKAINRK